MARRCGPGETCNADAIRGVGFHYTVQTRRDRHVVFEVDSDVVAKHMAKRDGYMCGSTDLRPYYEDCWKLGQKLTAKNIAWEVRHIYREYNQTADGLANLAIDDPAGNGPSQRW